MTSFMTNEQIITAAKNDIDKHIDNGTFYGNDTPADDEAHGGNWENFHSITSCYGQWAEDGVSADPLLWEMYEKDYPQYF